jgi:hypothetical protein
MRGPLAADAAALPDERDRWSLAISSLLILGLFLAAAAMVQAWRSTTPPKQRPVAPPKPVVAEPVKPASPAPQATAIRLPPPPEFKSGKPRPVTGPIAIRQPTAPRPATKPRIIVPLQRSDPAKPERAKPAMVSVRPTQTLSPLKASNRAAEKKTAPSTNEKKAVIDATQHRKTGGALLRLLEHGKGPTIEIAWPRSATDRTRLFGRLTHCYGMRPAILAKDGQLFDTTSPPGQPWPINRDRYSGFIRSPQGEPVGEENRRFASIARRHDLANGQPVRVFPRAVDAILLGGLGTLLGPRYHSARQIRARYEIRRASLALTGFRIDGQSVPGVVTLPSPFRGGCGEP